MAADPLAKLNRAVVSCRACPRLRTYCTKVARVKRAAFREETYWGKPITGFGDSGARLIVVGLAPAAHGANRTGRIFTGDRSGDWLYRALHRFGFANQPTAVSRDDGLLLDDAYITCVVKCAPPDNKPLPAEKSRCARHLVDEVQALKNARVFIALGQIALDGLWRRLGVSGPKPRFGHDRMIELEDGRFLLLSYHPSQQNTFTGRLTERMFDSVFARARQLIEDR